MRPIEVVLFCNQGPGTDYQITMSANSSNKKTLQNEYDSLLGCCAVIVWYKFTDVSKVFAASIIKAMTTRRHNPEDSHLLPVRCFLNPTHSMK
jgi:hypothetical protein